MPYLPWRLSNAKLKPLSMVNRNLIVSICYFGDFKQEKALIISTWMNTLLSFPPGNHGGACR
jgi:hypothetical protein